MIVKCATFLLSCQYSQAIQACNCNVMWFKSVRWHDDGSSGHTLGCATLLLYPPPSVYPEDTSSRRLTRIYTIKKAFKKK